MISFEARLGAEAEGRRELGVEVSVQPATIGSIWGSLPSDGGGGLRSAKWDEGASVLLLHAYGDLRLEGKYTHRTVTPTRAFTNMRPMVDCCSHRASPAQNPGCFDIIHNICCDDEGWSMSPIARTIEFRSSTVTDAINHNGTICIAPADSAWSRAKMALSTSVSLVRSWRLIVTFPMSVRASAFSPMTGRCRYSDIPAYGGGPSRMAPA